RYFHVTGVQTCALPILSQCGSKRCPPRGINRGKQNRRHQSQAGDTRAERGIGWLVVRRPPPARTPLGKAEQPAPGPRCRGEIQRSEERRVGKVDKSATW